MAGDSFISATAQESSSCFGDQPCSLYVLDHPRPPETSTNGLFAAAAYVQPTLAPSPTPQAAHTRSPAPLPPPHRKGECSYARAALQR